MIGCASPVHGWELLVGALVGGGLSGCAYTIGWWWTEIGARLRRRIGR
jgi:hypothetical protein